MEKQFVDINLIWKSRDNQSDNEYKNINIGKTYHFCRFFVSEKFQDSKKFTYMVNFSHISIFLYSLSDCISLLFRA